MLMIVKRTNLPEHISTHDIDIVYKSKSFIASITKDNAEDPLVIENNLIILGEKWHTFFFDKEKNKIKPY